MKKEVKTILFICKHNRFRSRVAEAYFNKLQAELGKKKIKTLGAGLIAGSYPLDKREVIAARNQGIKLEGKPQTLTLAKVLWADLTIIVADDIPSKLFDYYRNQYHKKIIVWKIPDIKPGDGVKEAEIIVKKIMNKIRGLVRELA
ncbi:hypothetical protein FJZ17_01265 [Candidatus Pacearchaeota archaeon]|nr:hypothetical protein [Candidatus Pacearchaeota archaeon]